MASKRLPMVEVDSSAASRPLPLAIIFFAMPFSSSRFILSFPNPLSLQSLYSGQFLALKPLQECPAGGRNIGEIIFYPRAGQGRNRIAAARHAQQPAGLGGLSDSPRRR